MKDINEFLNEGEKYLKGLHQAKVGDHIHIGVEGLRNKGFSTIAKVLDTNKLVDTDGNIFGRNGVIIRRKGGWAKIKPKGSIVSAQIVTQKYFDEQYKVIKTEFIKSMIDKEDIEVIEKIIDLMSVSQGNKKKTSRFD